MTDPLDGEHPDSVNGGREPEEPTEAELFPEGSLEGDNVTAQTYVRRGLPVEVTVALGTAEVPTRAGLLDPNKAGRVLVSFVPGGKRDVPIREDGSKTGKVVGWKLRQILTPTYVADASDEATVCRNAFAALLATDAPAAGALLAELRDMAETELGAPA